MRTLIFILFMSTGVGALAQQTGGEASYRSYFQVYAQPLTGLRAEKLLWIMMANSRFFMRRTGGRESEDIIEVKAKDAVCTFRDVDYIPGPTLRAFPYPSTDEISREQFIDLYLRITERSKMLASDFYCKFTGAIDNSPKTEVNLN